MKIAFWSYYHAHSSVSTSLLLEAACAAMLIPAETDDKVSVIQTQFKYNNLDYPLLGKGVLSDDFFGTGVDALLSAAKSRCVTEADAYNASISLLNERLFFYRTTRISNKESFSVDMNQFSSVVDSLNEFTKYVFIDLESGVNDFTTAQLRSADVVVCVLPQNQYFIEETLTAIKELGLEHVVYCVGNCDKDSSLNERNVKKLFHSRVNDKLFCIPHDTDLADAISGGTVQNFLLANNFSTCDKSNPHYELISSVHNGWKLIRKGGEK